MPICGDVGHRLTHLRTHVHFLGSYRVINAIAFKRRGAGLQPIALLQLLQAIPTALSGEASINNVTTNLGETLESRQFTFVSCVPTTNACKLAQIAVLL